MPEHDALDAGLAEVASEIARADSKAAALLAALGLPIAVLAAAVPGRDLPLAAGICITAAALTLAAAMGLTLLALRPSLPPPGQALPGSWIAWAKHNPESADSLTELRAALGQDHRAAQLARKARLALIKFRRLRLAVDLAAVAMVALTLAAVSLAVG